VVVSLLTALPTSGQDTKPEQTRPQQRRQPFQQVFALQGVEFSEVQQRTVQQLRTKYEPELRELQGKLNGLYTNKQRRARQEALRAARDSGKNAQEVREAADAAAGLTGDQKKQIATIQKQRSDLQARIQKEIRLLLTDKQRAQVRRPGNRNAQRRPAVPPTHRDLKYGPHKRNVMDVWLAKSDKPTPVLVSIHGGGFRGGNKSVSGGILKACLDSGISVVAITYRLSSDAIAPAQFHDSARAIQFIRHSAREWNLDPTRLAATGGSAGAGISLWLGFHENLADPENEDPVLRQSTRLTCMAVYNGQTSYDPRFIRDLFPGTTTYKESALAQLFGVDLNKLDDLPLEKYRLFEEVSALPHLTKDDAPVALFYASRLDTPITSQGVGIHHPRFGKALKEKMDELGIECKVRTGIPRGDEWTKLTVDFVKQHLGVV
jgi:acetyl esterase